MGHQSFSLQRSSLWRPALITSLYMFDPRVQFRNPVMFVVYFGSILTTCLAIVIASGQTGGPFGFTLAISVWLWFTILLANAAEALAEGLSKAPAESLRGIKRTRWAQKLTTPQVDSPRQKVAAESLRKGDYVLVEAMVCPEATPEAKLALIRQYQSEGRHDRQRHQ